MKCAATGSYSVCIPSIVSVRGVVLRLNEEQEIMPTDELK
jgi:hypothetical protein